MLMMGGLGAGMAAGSLLLLLLLLLMLEEEEMSLDGCMWCLEDFLV